MKGFLATFLSVFVICAFSACESTSQNDGASRFAMSPYNGPGSEPVLPPAPDAPPSVPDKAPLPDREDQVAPPTNPAPHGSI